MKGRGKLFILLLLLAPELASAAVCQSNTFCVHNRMPIWSQSDQVGNDLNGGTPPLLQYVQDRHDNSPDRDPGWCGGVSSAVLLKTYANEITDLGCAITGTYSWLTSSNPSEVIYNTFDVVGTNYVKGGTSMDRLDDPGNAIQTIYGGNTQAVGMPSVDNFRNFYQRPLIEIGVCTMQANPKDRSCHALTVHGTDGQFHVLADPWGSTYSVTFNKYDTIAGDTTVTYAGNPSVQDRSMIGSPKYGPTLFFYSLWGYTTSAYTPEAPTILSQPSTRYINQGTPATLSVQASPTSGLTYQWQKNGIDIPGATEPNLNFNPAQVSDTGPYQVVVRNCRGTVTSAIAQLYVGNYYSPTISIQPQDQSVQEGRSVTFAVQASGSPTPYFQWLFNGVTLTGQTSSSLTLSNITRAQHGLYQVIIANPLGSVISRSALLNVTYPPTFLNQPASSSNAVAGESFSLSSLANGNPPPTYQWQKGGTDISGATSSLLSFTAIQKTDQGLYQVRATNTLGSVTSSSASVVVNIPPSFSTQPLAQIIPEGRTLTLSALAIGDPTPTYQWKVNSIPISGAITNTLTITNINRSQQGAYQLEASNPARTVNSSAAVITVAYPPTITQQPASQTRSEGDTITFIVQTSGNPPPSFQWKWNGQTLIGETSTILTIPNVNRSRAGRYKVVATNSQGTVESNEAILDIKFRPSFTRQPPSFVVPQGAVPFALNVQVTGNPPPQLQWFQNGNIIPNATSNSLNLPLAGTGTVTGTYYVTATNVEASVRSETANVGLNPDQLQNTAPETSLTTINSSAGVYHFYPNHGISARQNGAK